MMILQRDRKEENQDSISKSLLFVALEGCRKFSPYMKNGLLLILYLNNDV